MGEIRCSTGVFVCYECDSEEGICSACCRETQAELRALKTAARAVVEDALPWQKTQVVTVNAGKLNALAQELGENNG